MSSKLNHFSAVLGSAISGEYEYKDLTFRPEAFSIYGRDFGGDADVNASNQTRNDKGIIHIPSVSIWKYGLGGSLDYNLDKDSNIEFGGYGVCENSNISKNECGYELSAELEKSIDSDSIFKVGVSYNDMKTYNATRYKLSYEKQLRHLENGSLKIENTMNDDLKPTVGLKLNVDF